MPQLADARHENFCKHLANCCNAAEAARRVGFPSPTASNTGCRLLKKPEIKQRIAELRALKMEKTEAPTEPETPESTEPSGSQKADRAWIESELMKIEAAARADSDFTAANRSLELLARLGGYLVDKKETFSETVSWRAMSDTQLNAVLRTQFGALDANGRGAAIEAMPELAEILIEGGTEPESERI